MATRDILVQKQFPTRPHGCQNGCFIMENPIKMDDLGVPTLKETPTCQCYHFCCNTNHNLTIPAAVWSKLSRDFFWEGPNSIPPNRFGVWKPKSYNSWLLQCFLLWWIQSLDVRNTVPLTLGLQNYRQIPRNPTILDLQKLHCSETNSKSLWK